jgi:hypothetical protein
MIKRRLILIAMTLMLTGGSVIGQVSLPLNSSGKAEFADVVLADTINKYELFSRGEALLPELSAFVNKMDVQEQDAISGKIVCGLRFTIYNQQMGILKKETGAVTYKLTIEVKDGKYRYSFTDIIFHYYQQDRNLKLVENGKTKGLEETKASGWQKTWNACRATTASKISNQINLITARMKERKKVESPATTGPEAKKLDW